MAARLQELRKTIRAVILVSLLATALFLAIKLFYPRLECGSLQISPSRVVGR
jgi:hypothetical protein